MSVPTLRALRPLRRKWFRNVRCQWCGHSKGARAGNLAFFAIFIPAVFLAPSWPWLVAAFVAGEILGLVANGAGCLIWGNV